jgi:hypothetical protein
LTANLSENHACITAKPAAAADLAGIFCENILKYNRFGFTFDQAINLRRDARVLR